MTDTALAEISVTDLPTYLIKPLPSSRVSKHHQTMAFVQLVKLDTEAIIEIAVCENVFAARTRSARAMEPSKWVDTVREDFASAMTSAAALEQSYRNREYISLVSQPLLLPLNETDTRHLREEGLLPRQSLEYGHDLMSSIFEYFRDKRATFSSTAPPPGGTIRPPKPPTAPVSIDSEKPLSSLLDALDASARSVKDALGATF